MFYYSDYQIQKLSQNPHVKLINKKEMILELRYKQELYDLIQETQSIQAFTEKMEADGFTPDLVKYRYYHDLYFSLRRRNRPKFYRTKLSKSSQEQHTTNLPEHVSPNDLGNPNIWRCYANTGKFFLRNGRLLFSEELLCEIFGTFPTKTVEQALSDAGFDPFAIGGAFIYRTEADFKRLRILQSSPMETRRPDSPIPTERVRKLQMNPLVEKATSEYIQLKQSFFRLSAVFNKYPIDQLLDTFMLDHSLFTLSEKVSLKKGLSATKALSCSDDDYGNTYYHYQLLKNRFYLLMDNANKEFERIKSILPGMTHYQKKLLCQWISNLPSDPGKRFNKSVILAKIGMSRTLYYMYVGSSDFGMAGIKKKEQDDVDATLIKQVVDYKGFKKGSRQIYMLLPKLTGKRFSISKIRRLMKAYGMESGIRKRSQSRKAAREREAAHVKPNLLKRMFRLHRPNEVRVTDVTYLDYGNDKRAYGSALMDPVTSRLIAFVVSENNDLEMALETIRQSDYHPCDDGGIFHSDQGILYKTDEFQKEVLERGYTQSMSKKGNCWDNATQESFFGHFKDECDYSSCGTLNELKKEVEKYADYYNNERGMWERGRMTPVEYEDYLLSLSPEEFGEYLETEKKKYESMKKNAAQLARQHAQTLGV